MKFTCKGSVRDNCGVMHRSYKAAMQHIEKDAREVKAGHGANAYTDRRIIPLDDEAREEAERKRDN